MLDGELTHEKAVKIMDFEQQTRDEADKLARNIIVQAIQRCAADHSSEVTVSVVGLPNDEMKGRIIGREGRNIRALETATGVDLIIDDTPEAITVSSFDPIRREIARVALEKLILDGRIHPARIEETVAKATAEVDAVIKQEGEKAMVDAGIHNLHPELVKLLGKLHYRTSYGQNVLKHSMEVCHIAGLLAAELGADVTLAKRAGLLHDIGKALDHEQEGTHIQLGVEAAKKYRENNEIINAIHAHHGEVEAKSVTAFIIQAADAISAARPGARRENIENSPIPLAALKTPSQFRQAERSESLLSPRQLVMIRWLSSLTKSHRKLKMNSNILVKSRLMLFVKAARLITRNKNKQKELFPLGNSSFFIQTFRLIGIYPLYQVRLQLFSYPCFHCV